MRQNRMVVHNVYKLQANRAISSSLIPHPSSLYSEVQSLRRRSRKGGLNRLRFPGRDRLERGLLRQSNWKFDSPARPA